MGAGAKDSGLRGDELIHQFEELVADNGEDGVGLAVERRCLTGLTHQSASAL